MEHPFTIGQEYKRSTIHDKFGGSRQSGISVSAANPYIFIFSGDSGHQHGYVDQWLNDDIFSYTGEGQLNDMEFVRGNLALRDHSKNGKRVFLFVSTKRSEVRYEGELEFVDVGFFPTPDREGKERNGIKFFLKKVGKKLNYSLDDPEVFTFSQDEIEEETNIPNKTERRGLVTSRIGQGAYRKSVLYRWEFKCAVTEYPQKEILIASHIVPWRDANDNERLDVDNGILLSPVYDALFDKHLISFENNGKIILSDILQDLNFNTIGISGKERIQKLTHGNQLYLERHREKFLNK